MNDSRRARLHQIVDQLPDVELDVVLGDLRRYLTSPDEAAGLLYRTPDGGPVGTPSPWSAGDLRIAAEALNWPAIGLADGRRISGEAAWREVLDNSDAPLRAMLHAALVGDADA